MLKRMKAGCMTVPCNPQQITVVLIAGGKSGEREISLASGDGAYQALCEAGFIVDRVDPAKKEDLIKLVSNNYDVAFLALHGKYGEDGTMQGMLEILGIPYIGSGVWSSATAIDKSKAKVYYAQNNIPTPASRVLFSNEDVTPEVIASSMGTDCVIKAATEGSALGVYLCHSLGDIKKALTEVFTIDNKALIEAFIEGDEFTVAVLGNEEVQALPVIQIVPINEFYDFESKYAEGGSQHICPAPLSTEQTKEAQRLAIEAHKALECKSMSRTDLIRDKTGKFWVLETNTIPGMTETSLLPDAAKAAGMTFSELCIKLIRDALAD